MKDAVDEVFGSPEDNIAQGVPAVAIVEVPEGSDVPAPKKRGRPLGGKNKPKEGTISSSKEFVIMLDALLVGGFALASIKAGKIWELNIDPETGESEARKTVAVPLARILTRYGVAGPVGAYGDFFLLAVGIMSVVGTRVIIAKHMKQEGRVPGEPQKTEDDKGIESDVGETTPLVAGSVKDSLPAIR